MNAFIVSTLSVVGTLLGIMSCQAVIVGGGDGTQNTTSTGAGGGWDYVGTISTGSGVYLGEYGGKYWVLSVAHVSVTDGMRIQLPTASGGRQGYDYVSGTWTHLTNPDGSFADLALYQITAKKNGPEPNLSQLSIASSRVSVNSPITLIGFGRGRVASSETYWTLNWTETDAAHAHYTGYKYVVGVSHNWGTNTIDEFSDTSTPTLSFDFDNTYGEGHVAESDSGGGVFYDTGTGWELVGIMFSSTRYFGQPENTAVFGNSTYAIDVSYYYSEIMSIIDVPEPSTWILLLSALGILGFRIKKCAPDDLSKKVHSRNVDVNSAQLQIIEREPISRIGNWCHSRIA